MITGIITIMNTVPALIVIKSPALDVKESAGTSADALVGEISCENVWIPANSNT